MSQEICTLEEYIAKANARKKEQVGEDLTPDELVKVQEHYQLQQQAMEYLNAHEVDEKGIAVCFKLVGTGRVLCSDGFAYTVGVLEGQKMSDVEAQVYLKIDSDYNEHVFGSMLDNVISLDEV